MNRISQHVGQSESTNQEGFAGSAELIVDVDGGRVGRALVMWAKCGPLRGEKRKIEEGKPPSVSFWILFKDVLMWQIWKNFAQNFNFDSWDSVTVTFPEYPFLTKVLVAYVPEHQPFG